MKGVSAIVATLLLLVITMGLAITSYFFINNLMTNKTAKVINIVGETCTSGTVTLVISNDGSKAVADSEIRILIDNVVHDADFDFTTVQPGSTAVATHAGNYTSGTHTILLVSPSGSTTVPIIC